MDARQEFDPVKVSLDAIYVVGPQVYELANSTDDEETNFLVLGCHGSGNQHQHAVAEMMNEKVAGLKAAGQPLPKFILFLGDNIYDHGANSPAPSTEEKGFDECFHKVYKTTDRGEIKELPCFFVLGNHDYDFDVGNANNPMHSIEVATRLAANQVARSYFSTMVETVTEKIQRFVKPVLNPDEIKNNWNMPYFFYSLIAGNTQVFCLDSNTFLLDFLALKQGKVNESGKEKSTGRVNQAYWLQQEYIKAKASGKQIIFAQHHPLRVAAKRAFAKKYDSLHYLTNAQISDISKILYGKDAPNEGLSYNDMLNDAFKHMDAYPDLIYAAHEHAISYNNTKTRDADKPLVQFISGGGGGDKLDQRHSFRDQPYLGLYQQHYGYTHITCNGKNNTFSIDAHIEGLDYPIRFNEKNHRPLIVESDNKTLNNLRKAVLSACKEYFNALCDAERSLMQQYANESQAGADDNSGYIFSGAKYLASMGVYLYAQGQMLVSNVKDMLFKDRGRAENNHIQDIHTYFCQHELGEFRKVVEELYKMTTPEKLPSRLTSKVNFYTLLEESVKKRTGFELDVIFAQAGLKQATTLSANEEAVGYSL